MYRRLRELAPFALGQLVGGLDVFLQRLIVRAAAVVELYPQAELFQFVHREAVQLGSMGQSQ